MEDKTIALFHFIAVLYDHNLIIWGGYRRNQTTDIASLQVCNLFSKKWSRIKCTGAIPSKDQEYLGQLIDHTLYAICQDEVSCTDVYTLDLRTMVWKQQNFTGTPPLTMLGISSWVWQEKIYLFGGVCKEELFAVHEKQKDISVRRHKQGEVVIDQFVAFNTREMAWEWPKPSAGPMPSPRHCHSSFVAGEYMLLFGGEHGRMWFSDLYSLHMPSHTWTMLQKHGIGSGHEVPLGRHSHSFTMVGENKAMLVGGRYVKRSWRVDVDHWMLHWAVGPEGITCIHWEPRKENQTLNQHGHQALWSPLTGSVYVLGGIVIYKTSDREMISLLAKPQSLFEAASVEIMQNGPGVDIISMLFTFKEKKKRQKDEPD